ncbi:hypothetical protein A2368_03675 [Candidatus Collierbacteria bacterium RIFOXYB1_FULL_49_13]|uniref:LamG-like jellyroll fold domain-containing protein n=1 Tax=Candidatus Collierbacteria bacterium RIFOXYB1_FULL_49_13 TaxID=1817728 RepID=A0A1F5FFD2_9BACT|nr:MAG: hypothetical protein A2368_03675 [Candidatus Collierbacteria bacterium RIFOXYB1_FULL_49_13]
MKFTRFRRLRLTLPLFFLLLLLPAIYFYSIYTRPAAAGWWDPGWQYRKRIDITNGSGSALTDFQSSFTIDTTDTTKFQSNCNDIRVTDITGKLLPFWIEENNPGCNNAATKIWTKIPSIPTSGSAIYIYYGNPTATAYPDMSGKKVFPYFEDFNGSSLPNNYAATGAYTVTGGNLTVTTGSVYTTQAVQSSNQDYMFEYKRKWTGSAGQYSGISISDEDHVHGSNTGSNALVLDMTNSSSFAVVTYAADGNAASYNINLGTAQYTAVVDTSYVDGFVVTSSQVKYYHNRSNTNSATGTFNIAPYLGFGYFTGSLSTTQNITDISVDWVLSRKFVATEPSLALASEETTPGPIAHWKFDEGSGQTPQDATPNNNDGILGATTGSSTDDPTWITEDQCVSGKCLKFDGGDYATIADSDSLSFGNGTTDSPFSISAWLYMTDATHFRIINKLNSATDTTWEYSFGTAAASDNLTMYLYDGGTNTANQLSFVSSETLTNYENQWIHVLATYDGSGSTDSIKIYLNGELLSGTIAKGASYVAMANSNNTVNIGYLKWSPTYANGFIDEPKIYPYALTADQVKKEYTSVGSGAAVSMGQANQQQFSQGLVGYWKMDEASWNGTAGEVIDSSGGGSNGVRSGNATTAAGKFGNGGTFDGTGDYVNGGTDTSLDSTTLTLSAWIKPTTIAQYDGLISKINTPDYLGWSFSFHSNNRLRFTNNSNIEILSNTNAVSTGSWQHIVFTYGSDGKYTFYVNGVSVGSGTDPGTLTPAGRSLTIGRYYENYDGYYYDGSMDEARIYNRALSEREVRDLYSWAPGPIAHWKMDEGTGTTASDTSGNNLTGTISGAVWKNAGHCKQGSCLNFTASATNCVTTSDSSVISPGSGNLTIEAWVNTDVTDNNNRVVYQDYGNTVNNVAMIRLGSDNKFQSLFRDSDGTSVNPTGTTTPTINTWYHITGVRDGTTVKIYVNGVLEGSTTDAGLGTISTSDGNVPSIGCNNKDGSSYWSGSIDDSKIYNYARTSGQIIEDMNAGHPIGGSPVGSQLLYWKLDEGHGTTANDTVRSNNGTISGASWNNAGKFNKSLSFDGSNNDRIYISDNNELSVDNVTLSLWAYIDDVTGTWQVLGWKGTDYEISMNNTRYPRFSIQTSGGRTSCDATNTILDLDTWYYLALTYDGTTIKGYVDGEEVESCDHANPGDIVDSSSAFEIANSSYDINGKIDEVKIYNFALTAEQIKQDYNAGSSLTLGVSSNEAADMTDGAGNPPVAEWKFDEKTGTSTNDTSGNNRTGTLGGDGSGTDLPTWQSSSSCHAGACLAYDKTDDYVSVESETTTFSLSAYTISAWVKTRALDAVNLQRIIYRRPAAGGNINFALYLGTDSKLYFGHTNAMVAIASAETISANTWYHVTGVWDGTNRQIYVNGKLSNSSVPGSATQTGTMSTHIGRDPSSASAGLFNGYIDDVKLYNYARTAAQIAYDYNRGAPIAHWKLDECQGNTANDASGNGYTGTLTIGASGEDTIGTCSTSSTAWGSGASGKYNSSMSFDGTDDNVDISSLGNVTTAGTATASFWIKLAGANDGKYVFSGSNCYQRPATFNASSFIGFYSGSAYVYGTKSLNDNAWHHIAILDRVSPSRSRAIYVDGLLEMDWTDLTGSPYGSNTCTPSIIGAYVTGGSAFSGQIDDFRFYNYALSATQVKKVMNEGSALRFGE